MKLLAIDPQSVMVSADAALLRHQDGDRYREPGTNRAMRLHKSPRGTMQPHFEYEPRWDDTGRNDQPEFTKP